MIRNKRTLLSTLHSLLTIILAILMSSCFQLKNLQENRYLLREAKISGQKTLSADRRGRCREQIFDRTFHSLCRL